MGEEFGKRQSWQRRAIIALAAFFLLLVIFYRPLLQFVARRIAIHYATERNLKLDFQLKGNFFSNLTVTKLHAVAVDSSEVEAVDADFVRVDYNLLDLVRGRKADFLRNIELRSVSIVLSPTHERRPPRQRPHQRLTLPSIFPARVKLTDVTLIVRDQPGDLVVEHLSLDLDPSLPGELRISKLQFPPGQTWSNLKAQTSYTNRDLFVRDLVLNDQDRVSLLNIDASRIGAGQLSLQLQASIGQGVISNAMIFRQTGSSLNATVHFHAKNLAADALNKYAAVPDGFLRGSIEEASLEANGIVDLPRSWNGDIATRLKDFHAAGFYFDRGVIQVSAQNGIASLRAADVVQGPNEFHGSGSTQLPDQWNGFGRVPASLQVTAKGLDLQGLTAGLGQQFSGVAEANGKLDIRDGTLSAAFDFAAGPIKSRNGAVEKISGRVTANRAVSSPSPGKPWFTGLKTQLDLTASNIEARGYVIDSASGSITSANELVAVNRLNLHRKENDLVLTGQYRLPDDPKEISRTGELQFSLNAPEVADFWLGDSPDKWNGPLQGAGEIKWANGIGNGEWWLSGQKLRTRNLELRQLNAQGAMANNVVYLNDLSADLNEKDFVRADGVVDLWGKHHYSGKMLASIADLSKLQPLLHAFGNENDLAGSFTVDWSGGGDAIKFRNSGKLKLTLENGRYGNIRSLQSNIDATYSPDALEIPTIFLRSDRMDFQAIVQAKGETLEITKIQLDQGQAKYASGYISVPFIWKNLGTNADIIPSAGKVLANFQSENIDIKKLFEDFGAKPIASGTLNIKLDAQGSVSSPEARLEIDMRNLRSERVPGLEPASFNLVAQTQQTQLNVTGKIEQAKVQPIQLTASFPFAIRKIAREGKLPDDTPIKANLQMPRSSVNFVREFVPNLQEVDGDAAIDIDLEGTVARPVFKGQADMTINVARASDPTLPALQNFKARLTFTNEVLTFDQFGGELSGGRFTLSGTISVPKLTSVNLDLKLKADSALIARSDALTVRTDADVQFQGPLSSVNVTGNVSPTNSQFLKNLDLIPIGLPGRPAPQPPESHPQLVFPPAMRGWKFDVAIKTKDPVLIRGNLATGGAVSDLRLSGTGARPTLEGLVRLEKVEATLPFSRLEIAYGFLYFNPDDPLNPKIDLHGDSVIQDYTIHVFIYGTSLAPEAVFSSEPPLPQEEIISLLSTGTTREQLTGNNNVLAGRAAMLLVQQLYRKIFKKGQATQSNSVFDRFDLDLGAVDPRTGQQQAVARFKINDQFVLVGDVGVGGDYKGMLKYLIRFH